VKPATSEVASLAHDLDLNLKPDFFARRLDSAEALPVGRGSLEVHAVVKPDAAGVSAEYQHHISENVAAFGAGYAGVVLDPTGRAWTPEYAAMAGVRVHW